MGLLWNTACRRLRRRGMLARYAEGAPPIAAHDRAAVEAHLAVCPTCAAEVVELRAIGALLRKNLPAPPEGSLAARGELWSVLEARIARTPQERPAAAKPETENLPRPPFPRLERIGYLLATPRSAPFGALVAVSIAAVGMLVFFGRHYPSGATHMASAMSKSAERAAAAERFTEISIIPSPYSVAAVASVQPPVAHAAAVSGSKSARQTSSAASVEVALMATRALQPRPAPIHVASMRARASRPPVLVAEVAGIGSDIDGPRRIAVSPLPVDSVLTKRHRDDRMPWVVPSPGIQPTPAPRMTPFTVVTAESSTPDDASASGVGGVVGRVYPPVVATDDLKGSDDPRGEVQDVPDARAAVDVAIELRRQRSLFSYATR